jgi:hypothetical protein
VSERPCDELVALDRPLTAKQLGELRAISSRAAGGLIGLSHAERATRQRAEALRTKKAKDATEAARAAPIAAVGCEVRVEGHAHRRGRARSGRPHRRSAPRPVLLPRGGGGLALGLRLLLVGA